jgi:hypothetical protein
VDRTVTTICPRSGPEPKAVSPDSRGQRRQAALE